MSLNLELTTDQAAPLLKQICGKSPHSSADLDTGQGYSNGVQSPNLFNCSITTDLDSDSLSARYSPNDLFIKKKKNSNSSEAQKHWMVSTIIS